MIDYANTKVGDVVDVPGRGKSTVKVKLTRPMFSRERQGDVIWTAPGYRWINSRGAFSGTALLHAFVTEEAADAGASVDEQEPGRCDISPAGTAAQKLAWYAERNLLRY